MLASLSEKNALQKAKKAAIAAVAVSAVAGAGLLWYWAHNYFGLKKLRNYIPPPVVNVDELDLASQTLKMNYRVLNLDNALLMQNLTMQYMGDNAQVLDALALGPALRMECSFRDWKRLERRLTETTGNETDDALAATGPLITFYGSNDYHHITLALLKRFKQPFNLLMFDNHPDWVEWYPGLHCGSWLNHAGNLPTFQQGWHVGGYSGEFEDHSLRYFTPWKLLVGKDPKIKVFPICDTFHGNRWAEVPQERLRFPRWHREVTKERLLEIFKPYTETLKKYPLYITLDKDVMRRNYTLQNWNSGEMSLNETLLVIETILELCGGRLLAMDIMGDFTKVETAGLYRAYLHSTQHEPSENNIPQEEATALNQRTNLKILRTVKAALLHARGLPPQEDPELPGENAPASVLQSSAMGQKNGKDSPRGKDNNAPPQTTVSVLPPGPLVNNNDFVSEIRDEATWQAFKHEPTDRSFAHISVVKVVVPVSERVQTEASVFFLQSEKWVFHWNFTRDILGDPGSQSLADFNALNYQQDDRDFVLLTITKYHDQGMYSFELAARDNLSQPRIIQLYQLLRSKVFFADSLYFRPLSKLHEGIIAGVDKAQLPVIESDKLFVGVKYQPLTIGTTFGYLKLVREESEQADIDNARWNNILLCESIPNDLPVISGLITSVLQTPLCHVALLCGNRGTPNIAQVGAFEDPALRELENKPVKYSVSVSSFTLELSTKEIVDAYQAKAFVRLRQGLDIELAGDVSLDGLVKFEQAVELKASELQLINKSIGAKALNCLQLAKQKIASPLLNQAFTIPFFYYHVTMTHIFKEESSLHEDGENLPKKPAISSPKQLMDDLLRDARENNSPDPKDYAKQCAQIRQLISTYTFPVDTSSDDNVIQDGEERAMHSNLLDLIEAELEHWKESGLWQRCDGIIFRSSTNAEDIEGFNAAGLYESIPITKKSLKDPSKRKALMLNAIRQVWASVWNFRGFEERRLFGLDSSQVQMAILCQPFFSKSQRCNGVAISAHPFRHDFPGALINVQKAGYLVTDSCGGHRPEQHVVWIYSNKSHVVETLCLSSLMDGQSLMTEDDVKQLSLHLQVLDSRFGHNTPGTKSNIVKGNKKTKFCVDIEFLIMNDTGEIVIIQCRPYKMVYEFNPERNKLK